MTKPAAIDPTSPIVNRRLSNRRLRALAAFLETVPAARFNMGMFFRAGTLEALSEHRCGTSACVAGWTPVAFPELFEKVNTHTDFVRLVGGRRLHIDDAAREVLGLNAPEAGHLFYGDHDTPAQAADAIRQLIKRRKPIPRAAAIERRAKQGAR